MSKKRFLSLWFPHFGAERILRQGFVAPDIPLAIIDQRGPAQVVSSRTAHAGAMGVYLGQSLRDAQAICPTLQTKHRNAPAEHQFLMALTRWAGKFSPWITPHAPDGLAMDITGCAHLFQGETGMAQTISDQCHDLGVTCRIGIADTLGAAWALARFAGQTQIRAPSGNAINQEARATRSRAAKRRHWERGGPQPATTPQLITSQNIAPPRANASCIAPITAGRASVARKNL